MGKLRVGVIFGGRSGEHEISLRSALTVISALDPNRYEIVPIGIARDGKWYLRADAVRMLGEATPRLGALDTGGVPVTLLPHPGRNNLVARPDASLPARAEPALNEPLEVVFPVLHGTYGEDGTVQGLLEMAGVPYVGAGVVGSAIGMDKDLQKRLLREAGIPVVNYAALTRSEHDQDRALGERLASGFGYPVFVKPNALGSSIGINKVKSASAVAAALDDAFQYDRKVLIEASCQGHEFECAVLGNDDPQASCVGEVVTRGGHDFYSYESKYVDPDGSATRIPAEIPRAASERIRSLSVAAFKALGLRGMARIDFLALPDLSEIFVSEANTIPGFTPISMYPKLWEASGLPLPKLVDRLIELALEEHRARAALSFTYAPKR